MISNIAGSASFKWAASACCAVYWLAREDPGVETTVTVLSWRTFCWLSTFSVVTHRLAVEEAMLPERLKLLLMLHGDRIGRAERRRTHEAPRSRGEADMVLFALVFTCKPAIAPGQSCVCFPLLQVVCAATPRDGGKGGRKLTRSLEYHCKKSEEGGEEGRAIIKNRISLTKEQMSK